MKRNVTVILFYLVSLMATSCSKVDALFNNGDPITEQRTIGHPFTVVAMFNNVNVKLAEDTHPHLELTCPKNLIEKVTTEVKDDTLFIKNENDFNWLRSFDYRIDLTVYYDSLRSVNYYSIGELCCVDSLRGMCSQSIDTIGALDTIGVIIDTISTHNFILRILEGSGNINLTFNCNVMKTVFSNGTSEVTLKGYAGYTEHYLRSYGLVHAEKLESNIVKVMSESTNDIYVWAQSDLYAYLSNMGNVYYKGQPEIEQHCSGDGTVIQLP